MFAQFTFLFPLQARQDGNVHAVGDYYSPALGLDVLAGGLSFRLGAVAGLDWN